MDWLQFGYYAMPSQLRSWRDGSSCAKETAPMRWATGQSPFALRRLGMLDAGAELREHAAIVEHGDAVMGQVGKAFVRPAIPVIAATLLTAMNGTTALANEHNCRRLENLAQEYTGVQLTKPQQQLKRRLVAWYNSNCRGDAKLRRAASPGDRDL